MRRLSVAALGLALALAACGSVQESAQGLRDRIADIDVNEALDGLRDCDRLSDTFVDVVAKAADTVDSLSERSGGRVPATDVREAVDNIAVSGYFDIAERIGCARLQQRLDTLDRLRDIDPESPAGTEFLDEILRQVESSA